MVYKWIGRFDEESPSGLYDREREGRPPKVDEEAGEELRCVLAGPPTEKGYEMTRWTTPTLAEHLRRETGTDVHPETVRDALGRLGFSWKCPRRQLPQDPDYEERMAEVERAIEEAGPGGRCCSKTKPNCAASHRCVVRGCRTESNAASRYQKTVALV